MASFLGGSARLGERVPRRGPAHMRGGDEWIGLGRPDQFRKFDVFSKGVAGSSLPRQSARWEDADAEHLVPPAVDDAARKPVSPPAT
jgi:hypothetical protein